MILTHSSSPGVTTLLREVDVVARHLRDVHEAFDAVAHLDERAERHQLGDTAVDQFADLVVRGELLPGVLLRGLGCDKLIARGSCRPRAPRLDLVTTATTNRDGRRASQLSSDTVDQAVQPPRSTNAPKLTTDDTTPRRTLAGLEVGEELVALFLLRLLEPPRRDSTRCCGLVDSISGSRV